MSLGTKVRSSIAVVSTKNISTTHYEEKDTPVSPMSPPNSVPESSPKCSPLNSSRKSENDGKQKLQGILKPSLSVNVKLAESHARLSMTLQTPMAKKKMQAVLDMPKILYNELPEEHSWFHSLLVFRGAVLEQIYVRVLCVLLVCVSLILIERLGVKLPHIDAIAHELIGLALGLLLVFRTNSAYDRFWEGRKSWSVFLSSAKNLSRALSSCTNPICRTGDHIIDVYIAFLIASKQRLRGESSVEDFAGTLKPSTIEIVTRCTNRASACLHLLSDFLNEEMTINGMDGLMETLCEKDLNECMNSLGACERIVNTPLPLPYIVQIHQLLFAYLMSLPLVLVGIFGIYLVVPASMMITFGLFGIEEAGHLIENPFGEDFCDLPLDKFIVEVRNVMESTFQFSEIFEENEN